MKENDWAKERAELEAEMKKDSEELRAILEEAKNDASLDPEMKKVMLDAGEKMLGADGFLEGMLNFASDVCDKCEEWEKKIKAIEKRAKKGAPKKGKTLNSRTAKAIAAKARQ